MSAFARAGRRAAIARELAPVVAVVALARARRRVALALALAWLARAVVARATARRGLARALRGRAVWITGASQGLGEATARACARLGARVVVSGRRAERCAEVAEECARLGAASAKCVVFDVCGTRSELSEACERAFEAAGGTVDVFVNAAGGSQACSALAGDDEDVDKALFQLNAIGAISLTKEVAKRMVAAVRRRKAGSIAPKIVGVCSVASKVPAPGQSVYAAAKSAYAAFLNSLRSEIANTGVKVVCVYPGPIATGMNGQERVIFRKNMADSTPSPSASKTAISRTAARPPSTKGRMNVDYVAARIVRSALADVDELVLAPQPIMALTYCVRFFPTLAYAALDVIGPKRARRADAGENMYDLLEKTREILESIGDVDSKDSKARNRAMKFKIFGDRDAPDWFLAEIFTVSKLSSVRVRLLCSHLVAVRASAASNAQPFGTLKSTDDDDATAPAETPRVQVDYSKFRKVVDDAITPEDAEAVVAALEYAIANATRFDVDETTLGRELEQLGLPKEHAEAMCKSYGKDRDGLRRAALGATVRVNGLRDLGWGVTFGSSDGDDENRAPGDSLGVRLTLDTVDDGRLDMEMSEEKFRVLLSELKAVRALMDDDT